MNDEIWFVGCIYKNAMKPFYLTKNFKLARQLYLLLRSMGYKTVATNAHFY